MIELFEKERLVAVRLYTDEVFDLGAFEYSVLKVELGFAGRANFKYIALGDVLVGFPFGDIHYTMYQRTLAPMFPGDLQSAGFVTLDRLADGRKWRLHGRSMSLEDEGILDPVGSRRYKLEVIAPKLEPHFQVS